MAAPLAQRITSLRAADKVDSKLAMGVDVIIVTVEKDRYAATLATSMVDNVLHKGLNEISLNASGVLEKCADSTTQEVPNAGDILAIIVGTTGINLLDSSEDIRGFTDNIATL